jgi:hypothetical protein
MRCPHCEKEVSKESTSCTSCGAVLLDALSTGLGTPDAVEPELSAAFEEETSVVVGDEPRSGAATSAAAGVRQQRELLWAPKREQVEGWAFKREVSHYDVLGLEETASKEELAGRMGLLKSKLSQWANNATDFGLQQVGSSGLSRFVEIEQLLGDEGARQAYDERLKVERHSRVVSELRKEVGIAAADGVLQWSEWIGLQEKARAVGVSAGELEEIIGEYRARGVLTGLSLANAGREVRTINELRDACGQDAGVLIEPLWNGALGDWLQRAANKPQLREFVEEVREEYEEARLSGVWLFLWEIGEKKLVLGQESGEEVLSAEAWAQGIESARLSAGSLEALKDRRLENWFRKAIGRDDLGRVAQQLREEQNHDLSTIVRATRAKGSDPIFEWKDGTAAYSLAELATQCDQNLEESKVYLFNKSLEIRLQQLGKAPLAATVSDIRTKYSKAQHRGVEMLVRELCRAAKINPYPILAVQQTVGFGNVRFGDSQAKSIQIENRGRGYAWGTLKARDSLPGLSIPGTFDLAENSSFQIKLDTADVSIGQYSTELTIAGEGLQEPIQLSISYEVAALDLTIKPSTIDMGPIPVGGKARSSITITTDGRGKSAGRVVPDSKIAGLTFTKKFDLVEESVIAIGLDTLFVSPGKYASNLTIEGPGFPRAFQIPIFFEVVPLSVRFDPPAVKPGTLMHGTKSKITLSVSCTPEGGWLVGKPSALKPPCPGIATTGELKGQHSEIEVFIDTTKLEAGKRFQTNLVLDSNVGILEVPIQFRTSRPQGSVIAWQTVGLALTTGILMYICRALLQNLDSMNQWFFAYGSDPGLIIACGAFGAIIVAATLTAFRQTKAGKSLLRRLWTARSKTRKVLANLGQVDEPSDLRLDSRATTPVVPPMSLPVEPVRQRRKRPQ